MCAVGIAPVTPAKCVIFRIPQPGTALPARLGGDGGRTPSMRMVCGAALGGSSARRRLTRAPGPHHPGLRFLERSLVCARAAPAASLPVAVQIRQNVAPLADSPSLDELSVEPSPEGGSVALKLVVSGHHANGTVRLRRPGPARTNCPPCQAPTRRARPCNQTRRGWTRRPTERAISCLPLSGYPERGSRRGVAPV